MTFDAYNQEINLIYTALTRGMEKCHLSPEMFSALKRPNDRIGFYEE